MVSHHTPFATRALFSKQAWPLGQLTFQKIWSAWEELHLQGSRFLRPASLLFEANHTPVKSKIKLACRVEALGAVGCGPPTLRFGAAVFSFTTFKRRLVPREGFPPPTSPF